MPTTDPDDDIINLYETIPKKFKEEERHYDNEKQVNIKLPFQMCVTGATGSGKTNAVINIYRKINAFDKIMIWAKDTEEPIYASFIDDIRQVEKKTGNTILSVSNTIADLPDVSTINKENTTLLIIDDMVTEKDKALAKVSEYWIRGRKKNVSCMFLSQSYFRIPKIIRDNSFYFIFAKISGERDLSLILSDYKLGVSDEQLLDLYQKATAGGFPNFFFIDIKTNDKNLRFRRNLKPLPPPDGTTDKATLKKGGPLEAKSSDTKTSKKRKTPDELSAEGKQPKRTGMNDKEKSEFDRKEAVRLKKEKDAESKRIEKEKRETKLKQDKFNLYIDREYAKLQAEEARLEEEENKTKAKILKQHIIEHEKEIERQRKEFEKHPFNQPVKMESDNPHDYHRTGPEPAEAMEEEDPKAPYEEEMGSGMRKRKRKRTASSYKKFKSGTGLDAELKALIQLVRI